MASDRRILVYLGIAVLVCVLAAVGFAVFSIVSGQGITILRLPNSSFHVVDVSFAQSPLTGYTPVAVRSIEATVDELRETIDTEAMPIDSNTLWDPAEADWAMNCYRASDREYIVSIFGPFDPAYVHYVTATYSSAKGGVSLGNANEERITFLIDAESVSAQDFDLLLDVLKFSTGGMDGARP